MSQSLALKSLMLFFSAMSVDAVGGVNCVSSNTLSCVSTGAIYTLLGELSVERLILDLYYNTYQ